MNFIQATNETLYAAERIVSIGPSVTRNGNWVRDVEISDVGVVEVYGFRVEEFLRQPVHSFPAQLGTYVIHLSDEEADGYWKAAVIGWSAARDGQLYPVTADGINDGLSDTQCILTPDGRVFRSGDGTWDSLDHLLELEAGRSSSVVA